MPSLAILSMRGVGIVPPYTPKAPQPMLSTRMKTMLGFFCCADWASAGLADATIPVVSKKLTIADAPMCRSPANACFIVSPLALPLSCPSISPESPNSWHSESAGAPLLIDGDLDRFRFGLLFTRGIIGVRRTGTDGRLLLERAHVVEQDLNHRVTYPEVFGKPWVKWVLFFWVNVQVVEAGDAVSLHFARRGIEFLEHHLPVTPFHAAEFVAHVNNDGFAVGFVFFPEEEVGLVDTVDDPVLRDFAASDLRERREKICLMHDFIVDRTSGYFARPPDNERYAQ